MVYEGAAQAGMGSLGAYVSIEFRAGQEEACRGGWVVKWVGARGASGDTGGGHTARLLPACSRVGKMNGQGDARPRYVVSAVL